MAIRSSSCLLVGALALSLAGRAEAQTAPAAPADGVQASDWAFSLRVAGGTMISPDQIDAFGFDGGGGTARLALSARPLSGLGVDWIEGQLSGGLTLVGPGLEAVGGVVDLQLGLRLAPRLGDVRPFLAIGAGVGFTGPFTRPVGSVSVGLEIALAPEWTLAPEVSLLHVVQEDGRRQSDDALFASLGLTLAFRAAPSPAPEREVEVEHVVVETVVEHDVLIAHAEPMPPADMADLLSLVDRAVPGSSLAVVMLVPPVLFEHDQTELTAAGEVVMHDVLDRIEAAPEGTRIVVEGHADQTGDATHNLVISRGRAANVGDWLVAHGVPRQRIRETGEGAVQPLVVGEGTATLAPNRRVTIRLETDRTP
jgi:outer membrane protein OmpA-like peptidoglycan-associated protein